MRPAWTRLANVAVLSSILFPTLITTLNLDCTYIVADKMTWNLEMLSGPHSVSHTEETEEFSRNTTYTLDICRVLNYKGVDADKKCFEGTQGNS